jgi:putative ABC transport system permease protein
MHWWIFGISGLGAMVLALVTVSFQTLRAAQANPVKSLRTE